MWGDPTFGGASALWNLMKERDLLTFKPLEARKAREAEQAAQAAALGPKMQSMYESRPTYAAAPTNPALEREQDMHRFRRAAAPLPQDVQAKLKTGGYDPVVDEEDEYASLLRMVFMKHLLDQTEGGDPPTPYTVQAGPAARAFPTMPSMMA